jgi:DNA-nicking Smr family endonuclease
MEDIFLKRYPHLDLHGYDRDSARVMVNDFILENIVLGNDTIIIIHGIGKGIIKREVHRVLSHDKRVLEYKTDNFNDGCTIVKLIKK